jgi:hypothetical protein
MKVYKPNLENMSSYLKENSSNYDGPKWYNIPSGSCMIRILPPWDPTGRVALTVYSHRIEYQGKNMKFKKYNWTCLDKTFGKPCKICESLALLRASNVDTTVYDSNSRTFYCNMIVINDPEYDMDIKSGKSPDNCHGTAPGTHCIMRLPKTLYDWLVSQITNPMIGDVTSIDNGIDIIITKEGTGLGTTYKATLSPNGRTAIPKEYLDNIESLYNLDEVFSSGFDDETMEDLTNHIKRSSNMISSGIQNMSQQMSGVPYVQQPSMPYQNNSTGQAPQVPNVNISSNNPPSFGQYASGQQNMQVNTGVKQQVPNSPSLANTSDNTSLLTCYGNYNPGDIKCVTCSYEVSCKNKK